MKIVLLDNIVSLGRKGDIKNVSDGYAMNFLFPQGKALPATAQNITKFGGQAKDDNLRLKEQINYYNKIKNTLDKSSLVFSAKASDKKVLYQGISIHTIIGAVREQYGIRLNESWFDDKSFLKKVARHKIILNLPNSEKVVLYINIKSL